MIFFVCCPLSLVLLQPLLRTNNNNLLIVLTGNVIVYNTQKKIPNSCFKHIKPKPKKETVRLPHLWSSVIMRPDDNYSDREMLPQPARKALSTVAERGPVQLW